MAVITTAPAGTTAPVVRGTIVTNAVGTTASVPEGCTCLLPSEAAARSGTYARCTETVCGYGDRDATGQPAPKYYYKAGSTGIRASVPAETGAPAPVPRSTTVPEGTGTLYPTAMPTSAGTAQTSAGSIPAAAMVPVITSPAIPSVTFTASPMMQAGSIKPRTGIVELFIGFFYGFFGGGKPTGTGNDQPGGNNEPAGDLPAGMKPVSQVTTHVPQGGRCPTTSR